MRISDWSSDVCSSDRRARLGVIAVLGNKDCADANGAPIAGLLARNGIRVLRNEVALLPGIAVLGVDDVIHCKGNMGPVKRDFERQVKALAQGRWRQPVVLLSHEPAFASYAPDSRSEARSGGKECVRLCRFRRSHK